MSDQSLSSPDSELHLIVVGASHCGVQSALAARRMGFDGRITLIGDEPHLPYHRPPLSKDVLIGKKTADQVSLRPESAYTKAGVDLLTGVGVVSIDRTNREVSTSDGRRLSYDYLLLATGARPRSLKVSGSSLPGVHYLRGLDDVAGLREQSVETANVVVIGGGYIGLETAASLRKLGARVTVVEAMSRVLQRVASPELSEFYTRVHSEEGVEIVTNAMVTGFDGEDHLQSVLLDDGRTLDADLAVIGIGVVPNAELAEDAGLLVHNGIVVDEFARSSDPHIYAAGDCARGRNLLYDEHLRVESVQNANDQGKAAIRHIAGVGEPYSALPWFWSDQYDVKLQIAGLLDGADQVVVRGDPSTGRTFSLCHLKDDVLLAVEAVNRSSDFLGAKAPIMARASMDIERLADVDNSIADCVNAP